MANGAGGGFGAQHSQTVENWFLNVPGLKIAVPGSPADAYDLMRAAIHDEDPVLFFEHKLMMNLKGALSDRSGSRRPRPRGHRTRGLRRDGGCDTADACPCGDRRLTVLADEGVSVELIDPRTLVPLDVATVGTSLDRTGRLLVVQESPFGGQLGGDDDRGADAATGSNSSTRRPRSCVATTRLCPTPAFSRRRGSRQQIASSRRSAN